MGILLNDEEIIMEVCKDRCPNIDREDFECEECKQQLERTAKAQLKKVVGELKERAERENEHCSNDCAHRGVSIWFDIYDWQDLLKEVE